MRMKSKRLHLPALHPLRLADLRLRDWKVYVLIPLAIIVSSVTVFVLKESQVLKRFEQAGRLYAQGRFEQAAVEYEALRRQKGVDTELSARSLFEAADIYYVSLQHVDRARQLFEQLIHDYPDGAVTYQARKKLAEIHEKTGNVEQAIALLRTTLAQAASQPERAMLSFRLGENLFQVNEFEEARSAYLQVCQFETSGHTREQALLRISNIDQMQQRWRESLAGFDQVVAATRCSECRLQAQLGLIDSHEALNDYASAAVVLRSINPADLDPRLRQTIERRLAEKRQVENLASIF